MKNFTKAHLLNFSVCFALLALMLTSACTSRQHFSFSVAPPAYQKQKKEATTPATAETPEATLTAGTTSAPTELPEIANLKENKAPQPATAVQPATQKNRVEQKQSLTLTQKVMLKKLQKQATKLERKTNNTRDTAAGPVSNRNAIGLILIGLVVALIGGLISSLLSTLGVLIVLIGLVLLILNYI